MDGLFDSPLDNLPSSLKHLRLGGLFSHPLDQLPDHLESLCIRVRENYNHAFDNLPHQLIKLKINVEHPYKQPFRALPDSIQQLSISCHHASDLILHLPSKLRNLTIRYENVETKQLKCEIPSALETFKMKKSHNTVANLPFVIQEADLSKMDNPKTIPSLYINNFIKLCISTSVTKLSLPAVFNRSIPPCTEWQPHLTTLIFGAFFNQSLSTLLDTIQ